MAALPAALPARPAVRHPSAVPAALTLPVRPEPPEPPPFPLVGALAPLAVAAVLFAVIREPSVLLLAVLTPVVAVAGVLDGRRQVRRRARRDAARHAAALEAVARAADARRLALEGAERRAAPGPEAFDGLRRPGEGLVIGTEDRAIEPLVGGARPTSGNARSSRHPRCCAGCRSSSRPAPPSRSRGRR